jgi:hypothetical protein
MGAVYLLCSLIVHLLTVPLVYILFRWYKNKRKTEAAVKDVSAEFKSEVDSLKMLTERIAKLEERADSTLKIVHEWMAECGMVKGIKGGRGDGFNHFEDKVQFVKSTKFKQQ